MASKKSNLKQKTKKKKWFSIYAPKVFNNVLIGESYLDSVEQLKGKFVRANLATIINDMKKQNVSVSLRIHKVIEGKGHTEVIGMKILQSHMKRLIRRGRTKIEDSFTVKTKDGVLIRIKPLVITSNNCKRNTASEVRSRAKEILIKSVSEHNFAKSVHDILTFRMQKGLKQTLSKLVPIRTVDIRVFEREPVRGEIPMVDLSEEIPTDAPKEKPVKKTEEAPVKEAKVEETKVVKEEAPVKEAEEKSEDKEVSETKADDKEKAEEAK